MSAPVVSGPEGSERVASTRPRLRVGPTEVGRGVFLLDPVPEGDPVLEFRGSVLDFAGTLVKGERECDALQIGPDLYLDLEDPGRLVNHSCDPNVGVRDATRLVALRDLRAGEEIRFDYSTTMQEDHWTLEPCRCGAPSCRGAIRDFRHLPPDTKLSLIGRNVVPAFIVTAELDVGRLTTDLAGRVQRGSERSISSPRTSPVPRRSGSAGW